MKQWFYNLKFRNKIMLICLVISLIPVTILGFFCYVQIRDLLIAREETVLKEALVQETNILNDKLDACQNAMSHVIWDDNIRQSLYRTYDNNYDMYITYRDAIDPLFMTIRSLHPEILKVTVYTDNNLHPHGDVLRPITDIETTEWYDTASRRSKAFFQGSAEKQELLLLGNLNLPYGSYTNIIYMKINYQDIFSPLAELFEQSYGVLLVDADQNTIYSYQDFDKDYFDIDITDKELLASLTDGPLSTSFVCESARFSSSQWQLYLYRPIETISIPANQITITVLIIVLCCLVILIICSLLLSRITVRPLEHLVENMHQIENGDLAVTVSYHSRDEIGRLMHSFTGMVNQLRHLIDEVLRSKIAQQKYEMRALQAQINPHFLYNSLSLINDKAIMSDQDEISEMAQLLSTFYRTTLNKGKNITTVRDELANIRSYISIQFIMHSDSFDVIYDIDEDVLACQMVNLLLQPLVENAIMHGIDYKEDQQRGILRISCRLEENTLIFIIQDNGNGMTVEKCESILTEKSRGYGVQNVHHRIQLVYGTNYGLTYESTLEEGTRVVVRIAREVPADAKI